MNKNPTKVYVIACDETLLHQMVDGEYSVETRVCHNFGVYLSEMEAKAKCIHLNENTEENPEGFVDYYYVLPLDVKDSNKIDPLSFPPSA